MATLHACEPLTTEALVIAACQCEEVAEGAYDSLIDTASDALQILAGDVPLGRCEVVLRPCAEACSCYGPCGCDLDAVVLPGLMPAVTEVMIDGVVLDPANYAILDGNRLVRVSTGDRPEAWPRTQRLWRPTTEEGTWSITITHGFANNEIVQAAATALVCALLPQRRRNKTSPHTATVTAGGTTISLLDLVARLREGDFAIPEVTRLMTLLGSFGGAGAQVLSPELNGHFELHVLTTSS